MYVPGQPIGVLPSLQGIRRPYDVPRTSGNLRTTFKNDVPSTSMCRHPITSMGRHARYPYYDVTRTSAGCHELSTPYVVLEMSLWDVTWMF